MKKSFQRIKNLKKYILEIIAIFIGITFSFWVENYREDLQERKVKKDVIQELYLNLGLDSIRAEYVRDTLVGHVHASFSYTVEELQKGKATDSELAMMLAYWHFHTSFWQTQFAFDRMKNLSTEEILSPGIMRKLDFYYQVVNQLHGLRRSETAKKLSENRMEYLTDKGIYVPVRITYHSIPEVPELDVNQRELFYSQVVIDPVFEAHYNQQIQMMDNWNYSLSLVARQASAIRADLVEFYSAEYGKDLMKDAEVKNYKSIL